jgi:hypothetical protein
MVEQKGTHPLLDRKKLVYEKNDDMKTDIYKYELRKYILLSRGDSLTNDDLSNHHKQIRNNKLSLLLWSIPFLEYYFLKLPKGPLMSIPLTSLLYIGFNKLSFTKTEYTYSFAKKAERQHLDTVLRFNLRKIGTPIDKWDPRQNNVTYAEWIAKNEYK